MGNNNRALISLFSYSKNKKNVRTTKYTEITVADKKQFLFRCSSCIAEFTHILHTFVWLLTCLNAMRTHTHTNVTMLTTTRTALTLHCFTAIYSSANISILPLSLSCSMLYLRLYLPRRLFDFRHVVLLLYCCRSVWHKNRPFIQANLIRCCRFVVFSTHARNVNLLSPRMYDIFPLCGVDEEKTQPSSISVEVNTCKCS